MKTSHQSGNELVSTGPQALAMRSAAIVARGLRDLTRDSNWLIKKAFSGRSSHLKISSSGALCAVSPLLRNGMERLALHDIELGIPTLVLTIPGESSVGAPDTPASFGWSADSRYLIAAWGAWTSRLHAFDVQGKMFIGSFGEFSQFPHSITWSENGTYLAVAPRSGSEAELRLWYSQRNAAGGISFSQDALAHARLMDLKDSAADPDEEVEFSGFGKGKFSPDESTLASVIEVEGDWADDSIALFEVPSLRKQLVLDAQGHITDLTWTPDGKRIIYCSSGQAYRFEAGKAPAESLPFGAELCANHPQLPLCLFFSSWLKNSAKGRLFLADLNRLTVFDEYPAEGIVDLRWSFDGSKAYAISADGLAYIYEPPLL